MSGNPPQTSQNQPAVPGAGLRLVITREELDGIYAKFDEIALATAAEPTDAMREDLLGRFMRVSHEEDIPLMRLVNNVHRMATKFEDRLAPILAVCGRETYEDNEYSIRDYVFWQGPMAQAEDRVETLEARMAYIEKSIAAALEHDLRIIKARKNRDRANEQYVRNALTTTMRAEIWKHTPDLVTEACDAILDYYHRTHTKFSHRLNARFRKTRAGFTAEEAAKVTSPRRRRVYAQEKPSPAPENAGAEARYKNTRDFLERLHTQAAEELETLREILPIRRDTLEAAHKSNAMLAQDTQIQAEMEAELRARIARAANARLAVIAAIHAWQPGFADERESEIKTALAPREQGGMPFGPQRPAMPEHHNDIDTRDIAPYLAGPDAGLAATAREIIALRKAALPLENELEILRVAENRVSIEGRHLTKQLNHAHKYCLRGENLLREMDVELPQLEYALAELKAGAGTELAAPHHINGHAYPPLKDIGAWARENLAGRVHIINRAINDTARSPYERPADIYHALTLLRDEYWEQKMSGGMDDAAKSELRRNFSERCAGYGLSIGASFSSPSTAKYAEDYKISYKGQRLLLGTHLVRGVTRDERRSMRVYFTWHEAERAVIVGHMPGHLRNRFD